MAYIIQRGQREAAKRLGVLIVPSKDPDKKIAVFRNGVLVAQIGQRGYMDYFLYL